MASKDYGKLCYAHNGGSLACKKSTNDLIFKVGNGSNPGDILIVVTSEQENIGPISSCGNKHNVTVSISFTGSTSSGVKTASITVAPVSGTVQVTTSTGCAYPAENPPMSLTVCVIQQSTGKVLSVKKSVANVASGSFYSSITVNDKKELTGLS